MADGNMLQVLIVDDEEVVRNGLSKSECFPKTGFRVVGAASNGKSAVAMTKQLKPDLVITDINMPIMDGLSYIEALRKSNDDTSVLIVSCYDDFQYAQKAMRLDVTSYLLKPFTDRELMDELERVKKNRQERKTERNHVEMEKFLLDSTDSLLLGMLRQTILGDGETQIFDEIHKFHLMPIYPFYALLIFQFQVSPIKKELERKLKHPEHKCYLVETAQQQYTALIASQGVSMEKFRKQVQELVRSCTLFYGHGKVEILASDIYAAPEASHKYYSALLQKAKQRKGQPKENETNKISKIEIQHAITYIKAHLCEKSLCLNTVAESIFISPFYFSRLFTQEMGISFVKYVNTLRVEKACAMLCENRLKIYEISEIIGFQNETYFHQVFKSIKGKTPKKYQRDILIQNF